MAFITAAIAWIVANWVPLVAFVSALLGAGALLAKITPSPADDRFFAAALRYLKLVPVPKNPSAPKADAPVEPDVEPPIMG